MCERIQMQLQNNFCPNVSYNLEIHDFSGPNVIYFLKVIEFWVNLLIIMTEY